MNTTETTPTTAPSTGSAPKYLNTVEALAGLSSRVWLCGGGEFYIVLCTLQLLKERKRERGPIDDNPLRTALLRQWVHIPTTKPKAPAGEAVPRYFDGDLFKYKTGVRHQDAIQEFLNAGLIARKIEQAPNGKGTIYYYKPLERPRDYVDLRTIPQQQQPQPHPYSWMQECITKAQLSADTFASYKATAPENRVAYLDLALSNCEKYPSLFFFRDAFAGRVHTPFSSLERDTRAALLIDGEQTASLDVAQMQPSILGALLRKECPENEFSKWIDAGRDIYELLQQRAQLSTRDEAKKLFFEVAFSRPTDELQRLFGSSNWVNWVNAVKSWHAYGKPAAYKGKTYNSLAWLLQNKEVKIMGKIWSTLAAQKIVFLTVHDEIICKVTDADTVKNVMHEHLSKYLPAVKINVKY